MESEEFQKRTLGFLENLYGRELEKEKRQDVTHPGAASEAMAIRPEQS
jgi:hypothetical protein